jgi:hypothetical protein
MNADDWLASHIQLTVAPDRRTAVGEAPYGSFLIEAVHDLVPDDLELKVVDVLGKIVICLEYSEESAFHPRLHYTPREGS